MIMVQCAIVQGLGVVGFCPEEKISLLSLVHVADDRSRMLRTFGIVGYIGSGKIQAEANQIGNQFYSHHRQQQIGGTALLESFLRFGVPNLFFCGILRHGFPY